MRWLRWPVRFAGLVLMPWRWFYCIPMPIRRTNGGLALDGMLDVSGTLRVADGGAGFFLSARHLLLRATGSIVLDGVDFSTLSKAELLRSRLDFQMVFQNLSLLLLVVVVFFELSFEGRCKIHESPKACCKSVAIVSSR